MILTFKKKWIYIYRKGENRIMGKYLVVGAGGFIGGHLIKIVGSKK